MTVTVKPTAAVFAAEADAPAHAGWSVVGDDWLRLAAGGMLLAAGGALCLPPGPAYAIAALAVVLQFSRRLDVPPRGGAGLLDGPRIGAGVASALAAGVVGALYGWTLLGAAAWVTVAVGVLLAAIDVRVQRLPFALTGTSAACTGLAWLAEAASTGDIRRLGVAMACGVVAAVVFGIIAVATGQLGGGDVALAATVAFSLGRWGPTAAWSGLSAGFLFALPAVACSALTRDKHRRANRRFALGPPLLAGWYVTLLARAP